MVFLISWFFYWYCKIDKVISYEELNYIAIFSSYELSWDTDQRMVHMTLLVLYLHMYTHGSDRVNLILNTSILFRKSLPKPPKLPVFLGFMTVKYSHVCYHIIFCLDQLFTHFKYSMICNSSIYVIQ